MFFRDRQEAGRRLALRLLPYRREHPLVLALPRGGVPVGYEIARALESPLDLWIVKKIGAPGFREYAIGAVAEGGHVFLNREALRELALTPQALEKAAASAAAEVESRGARLRGGGPPPDVRGKTVILVDDGVATGATLRAAIESLKKARVHRIILALPVAAPTALDAIEPLVDETLCLHAPADLVAVGAYYDDFHALSDAEVMQWLARSHGGAMERPMAATSTEVVLPIPGAELEGTLTRPEGPVRGLVLFAHGSGSSRKSPRNRHVAALLHRSGLATLLFDLLTASEGRYDEETAALRFDIPFLARRLVAVTETVEGSGLSEGLPIGYFGASTGAAAALEAAAEQPEIRAVVSRGGRPDLAMPVLTRVTAPTLLLVGGEDREVLALNRRALAQLNAESELLVIPGATHLFEEAGALEQVAQLAAGWFARHLPREAEVARRAPER